MAIVEFKDVTRVYTAGDHELKALDGVNFTLEEGKFVVILGPSGAGESSFQKNRRYGNPARDRDDPSGRGGLRGDDLPAGRGI